jgi:hypothetical protein
MSKGWWLLFTTAILSVWNAGIVWFTQIAVYPLWPLVDAQHFPAYHLTWWHDMWPAFAMGTHWLRVAFFLVYAALMVWMVTRSLSRELRLEA